ncbi:MAG: DUF4435 domain-containing protein [Acidovorax sp.]|nr:DUF4435 domain-containing protein [Acidovorax sp.]
MFEPLQDVDVYVEDKGDETFYKNLLTRVFGDELKIAKVFARDGRINVISAYLNHDHNARRAIFLIDGDLEFVKGDPKPHDSPALHRLEAYCIENLLICQQGMVKIMMEELDADIEQANNLAKFTEWLGEVEAALTALFAAFAVLHFFDPTKPTVSSGVGSLCKQLGKHNILCEVKVQAKIDEVLELAYQTAEKERVDNFYMETLISIRSREHPHRSVSGKDFLLPLLLFKLQSTNCKVSYKALRRRLSLSCDLSAFQHLKADTLHVAGGGAML